MGLFSKLFNFNVKTEEEKYENQAFEQNQNTQTSGEFSMIVEDIFTITGRGTVITGRIDSGTISIGEKVLINSVFEAEVTGIEMFRKTLDYAAAGDNVGLLLNGINRNDICQGALVTKKN